MYVCVSVFYVLAGHGTCECGGVCECDNAPSGRPYTGEICECYPDDDVCRAPTEDVSICLSLCTCARVCVRERVQMLVYGCVCVHMGVCVSLCVNAWLVYIYAVCL